MALSPALVDREHGKFRDAGGVTSSRVAVVLEDLSTSSAVTTASNTRPTVTNVSASILAANTARKMAIITNQNGVAVYLALGTTAVVGQGVRLGPNESFRVSLADLWTGAINAIKSTATSVNLEVFEGT